MIGARIPLGLSGPCRALATSVFRSSSNGAEFLAEASRRLGVDIELIDGRTEAHFTWLGVSAELAGSHGRLAVLDLGGGSLECVWGDGKVEGAHTLPLGVLRTRHLDHDAVRELVSDLAAHSIDELLRYSPDTVVLSSGTARALLRLARRAGLVVGEQRHLWRRTVSELVQTLARMDADALRSFGVDASRLDTIGVGAVTFDALLEPLARPVVYMARSATREGALIDLARRYANRGADRMSERTDVQRLR
jgi:exopolyphosphatase/guanosine-5'-triphosphate,3'-diphosphate pyrophosphatase